MPYATHWNGAGYHAAGRSRKLLLTLWIISCLFAGLYVLRFAKLQHMCVVWPHEEEYSSFPQNIAFCVVVHPHLYVIAELAQILPFYILLPLNVYMYATMIYSLNKRASSNKTSLTQDKTLLNSKLRTQVARLLILNGIVFFICQSPVRIASIHNISMETFNAPLFTSMQYGIILVIGRTLLFLNSAVNPLIYIACSSFYRKAILEAVFNTKYVGESSVNASNSAGGQRRSFYLNENNLTILAEKGEHGGYFCLPYCTYNIHESKSEVVYTCQQIWISVHLLVLKDVCQYYVYSYATIIIIMATACWTYANSSYKHDDKITQDRRGEISFKSLWITT